MSAALVEIVVHMKDQATALFDGLAGAIGRAEARAFSLRGLMEALAAREVVEGVVHLVESFADEELALTKVNAALRITGRYSEESSGVIQRMAAHIQDVTTVSRIAALNISAMGAAMARSLNADQLAQLQEGAVGLAQLTGRSTEQASLLIVKSLTSQTNALRRWGINVDVTADQQTRFNQIMAQTMPLFQLAVESTHTLTGEVEQAKNAFAETERVIGEILARVLGLEDGGTKLKDRIDSLTKALRDHGGEIVRYIQAVIASFGVLWAALNAGVQIFTSTLSTVSDILFGGLIAGAYAIQTGLSAVWEGVLFVVKKGIDIAIIDPLNDLFGVIDGLLQHFGKSFKFRIGELDTGTDPFKSTKENARMLGATISTFGGDARDQAKLIEGSFSDVGDAWTKVVDIMKSQPLPLTGGADAGAGKNIGKAGEIDPSTVISSTLQQVSVLNEQFKDGAISATDFWKQMITLRQSLEQLRTVATTQKEIEDITKAIADLNKQGAVAAAMFAGDGTHLAAFFAAIKQLDPADQFTALKTVLESLNASFQAGSIGLTQYHAATAQIRDAMIALRDSGQLTQAEVVALTRALNGLSVSKSLGESLKEAFIGVKSPLEDANKQLTSMATGISDSLTSGIADAITAGGNFGDALEKSVNRAAASYAKLAIGRSLMELAEGFAASILDPPVAASHFTAAAEFAAAAVAMSALAGATGGMGGGGGGGGGGASAAASQTNAVSSMAQSELTLVVPATFTNDPQFIDALAGAMEQVSGRRVTVQTQG